MKSKKSPKEIIKEILRLKKNPQYSSVILKIKKLQQLL
tara:strand:+ start:235 stop:348 length:114 start_codon:yes stop_codon:yes gene_type:complete